MKCDAFFVRSINPIQGSKDWSKGVKTDCMIISDFKEKKKKKRKEIYRSKRAGTMRITIAWLNTKEN